MSRIKVLPPHIASQIAAGEVIEHPAAVVKELVENAVDAGASSIVIETEGGGKDLIRVTDDGLGMSKEDLVLAVKPHATSKIQRAEDLFSISTLGFRGEALASIGAVSRLSIVSRRREETGGWRIEVRFGKESPPEPAAARAGTSVTVQDLFEAIPARRKFLKSAGSEQTRINLTARLLAAAHSHVKMELIAQGKQVFKALPRNGPDRLRPLLGKETTELITVTAAAPGISIEGYITPRESARPSPRHFHIFLNNRPIKSGAVWKAVTEGCSGLLQRSTYPAGALFITTAPDIVDVNVHPAKQEVKFQDPNTVFRLVYHAVRRGLEGDRKTVQPFAHSTYTEEARPTAGEYPAPWMELKEEPSPPAATGGDPGGTFLSAALPGREEEELTPSHPLARSRVIGQLHSTYILLEGEEGLLVVDQHACHEAVLFKRLQDELSKGGSIAKQLLSVPITIDLEEFHLKGGTFPAELLEPLGFEVEEFGPGQVIIRAVPELLAASACDLESVREVFLSAVRRGDFSSEPMRVITSALACRGAVKANRRLSVEEMESLITQAVEEDVHTCPHGRPVYAAIGLARMERMLGRS